VPLALGLLGFLWSLKNGQYQDAAWRAIADDAQVAERPPDRFA
jgi:cbb3-type cytochrome oxidase maturation protein